MSASKKYSICVERASGQLTNCDKLALSFSVNVGEEVRDNIKHIFNTKEVTCHETNLELPSMVSKNKKLFWSIKKRVLNKL